MKKIIRVFIVAVLSFSVFFVFPNTISADQDVDTITNMQISGQHDINNSDSVQRELTFEEMVQEIAVLQNKPVEEIRGYYIKQEVDKILSRDSLPYDENSAMQYNYVQVEQEALIVLQSTAYYTDTFPLKTLRAWVGGPFGYNQTYYSRATLYYSYTGTSSQRSIQSVLYAGIIGTDLNGLYKSFGGDFYINVENTGKIHYIVNGSFYNTGTSTNGVTVNIGVGKSASVSISSSVTTNFFGGVYVTGDRYSFPR